MGKTHCKYPRHTVLVDDETGEKTIVYSDDKINARLSSLKGWGERMALARQLLEEVKGKLKDASYGLHVDQAELFHERTWGH